MSWHSLFKSFGLGDETTPHNTVLQHSGHPASELLGLINHIKEELQKVQNGVKSSVDDLNALKGNVVGDALVLLDFVTTNIHGKPVDDSQLEMEKIIEILYTLPSNSQFGKFVNKLFIGGLWKQLPHAAAGFSNQAGYQWRSADGSGNNLLFPDIGKAGEKFIQDCVSKRPRAAHLPDAGLIFDELLKRCPDKNGRFKGNESGVSSNLFYFATLITHDLFNTDPKNRSVNLTTSYLDLSPLYGYTKKMQEDVRLGTNGLLKPDAFADDRFWFQPDGVTALVVLFSRNHNYLAENLLKIDENARFSSIINPQERDEALFQTARLINERTYVNIILHDYLRVILNVNRVESTWTLDILQDFSTTTSGIDVPSATGNQCSLEFNFIYRWHHATSVEDEKWLEEMFSNIFGDWKKVDVPTMFQKLHDAKKEQKTQNTELIRDENGRFKDEALAKALIDGCNNVAGAFGGQNTPAVLRNVEMSGILHARNMGVCTLNEYRNYLKLTTYKSFKELNPALADRLAKLYKTIDDVELYPGLLCERQKPSMSGSGLCANYTTSFAILSDAVALVRGDRFHTRHATYFNLTEFGMEDSQSVDTINYGTLLGPKLISRHLKKVYKPNSVYAVFPFTVPSETVKHLGGKQTNYDFTAPL